MRISELPGLIIKKVYSANRIHSTENVVTKRNNREAWAIAIKHIGRTEYDCNGKTVVSDKENIVLLPKGCSYFWKSFGEGECLIVDFEAEGVANDIYSFRIHDCAELVQTFYKMEHEKRSNHPAGEMKCIELCYHLLVILLRSSDKNYSLSSKENLLTPIMDLIASDYCNPDISSQTLAKMTGISTVYFRKIFAEAYGMPPTRYILTLRMQKAAEILRTDHGTISDIAQSVGYNSLFHFSKMFRKYYGVSPSEFQSSPTLLSSVGNNKTQNSSNK